MITLHPLDHDLARGATALAHPARVHLVRTLAAHPDLTVSALVKRLKLAQPSVSRHLAVLRDAGLITVRREGRFAHYRADGPALRKLSGALAQIATRVP